jgi:hypothetical protein
MNQISSITTLSTEEIEQVSGATFGCAPCGGGFNLFGNLFGGVAQLATGVVGAGLGIVGGAVNLVGGLLGGLFGGGCRPCK